MGKVIVPIVEGYGEVEAVPNLIRRILNEKGAYDLAVRKPIRQSRGKLCKDEGLLNALRFAAMEDDCGAIVVIIDADDDPPCILGPELLRQTARAFSHIPIWVELANKEFEAWFIAGIESLAGYRGIPSGIQRPEDPEDIRDAKGWLDKILEYGWSYSETIDQAKYAFHFDYRAASTHSRSLRRFISIIEGIIRRLQIMNTTGSF